MEIKQIIANKYENYFIQDNSIKIVKVYENFNICEVIYNKTGLRTFVDVYEINKEKRNEKYISFHRLRRYC